ncbi:hypothetical protein AAMO2058_000052200 [Amorphochlora amoebiformis]
MLASSFPAVAPPTFHTQLVVKTVKLFNIAERRWIMPRRLHSKPHNLHATRNFPAPRFGWLKVADSRRVLLNVT